MEFLRQIVHSNTLKPVLTLPPSFQNVPVEIIVFHVDNGQSGSTNTQAKPVKHSAFGRLKAYANPSLIREEEGAWEKAAMEKYALH